MKRFATKFFSLIIALSLALGMVGQITQPVMAVSPNIVIYQIYGGGGNTGAQYTHDYVVLFNRGATSLTMTNWSIQYTSPTGTGNFGASSTQITEIPSATLLPGQYYLIQEASQAAVGVALPTPDLIDGTPIAMGAASGKVALVDMNTTLGCNGGSSPCNATQLSHIIDLVGYGTANFYETAAAPTLTNTTAAFRADNGCTDTDNNSVDFSTGAPSPKNTSSPLSPCSVPDSAPTVSSTTPADGSTNVSTDSDVTVTFSEAVDVTGTWATIECTTSGAHAFTVSGGPTTFTLNPNTNFSNSETCTLTVVAAQVSDQDTDDPPDNMAANFTASFTTVPLIDSAPTVSSTTPEDGAIDVAINSNVTVTFSEPVVVASGGINISCANTGAHLVGVSGGPTTFTVDPTEDFGHSELCTISVDHTKVTDIDTNDPPDTMAADASFTFTTVADPCLAAYEPIYNIQGSGATVALSGTRTTRGVVIGDFEGASPALRGFYIQDPTGDGNPATSDGIFVFEGSNANTVSLGDVVMVTGTAGENQGQSQISVGTITKCGTGTVAPTVVDLPVADLTFMERYEGMLVTFPEQLFVTENYYLGRFGQVTVSGGDRLDQPTAVTDPGAPAIALAAANLLNKVIVDDSSQTQNPDPIVFGRGGLPLSASNTLRGRDSITGLTGVMTYTWAGNSASGNAWRVRPVTSMSGYYNFTATNPRPTTVPAVGGSATVVGMNVLNYFNTFSGCTFGVGGAHTLILNAPLLGSVESGRVVLVIHQV